MGDVGTSPLERVLESIEVVLWVENATFIGRSGAKHLGPGAPGHRRGPLAPPGAHASDAVSSSTPPGGPIPSPPGHPQPLRRAPPSTLPR